MPPPRTRFSSPIGTGTRWKPSAAMVGRGCGSLVGAKETRAALFSLSSSTRVSTTLFQVPHSEQRPDHLGKMCPHCSQTKAVLTLAIVVYLAPSSPFTTVAPLLRYRQRTISGNQQKTSPLYTIIPQMEKSSNGQSP
jgi:hypothetical protein